MFARTRLWVVGALVHLTLSQIGFAADVSSSVRAEYEAKKAAAGPDAASQVQMALWCEEHGLRAERLDHLRAAVASDSGNTLARGLLGELEHGGKWLPPDRLGTVLKEEAIDTAIVDEYHARRIKLDEADEALQKRVGAMKEDAAAAGKPFEKLADERENAGDAVGARQLRQQASLARIEGLRNASSFQARRTRALAMDHVKLGEWCEKNGLKTDAMVEYTVAVHIKPRLDDAWHRLGYVRHNGRWMSPEDVQAEREEAKAQAAATSYWETLLKRSRKGLSQKANRAAAIEDLAKVNDARAVGAVRRVFITPSADDQMTAVKILSGIDGPASTRVLASLAILSAEDKVRDAAVVVLKTRPTRDYVPEVLAMIHTPATYQYLPVMGPGSRGSLLIDTPRVQLERSYIAPVAFTMNPGQAGYVGYDNKGLPVAMTSQELSGIASGIRSRHPEAAEANLARIEARTQQFLAQAELKAGIAQQLLVSDIEKVESFNAQATEVNSWARDVLTQAAGAPDTLKDDEDSWQSWWGASVGYSYEPSEKEYVSEVAYTSPAPALHHSCFVAGTLVATLNGPKEIETIRAGDRVLTQNTDTGALGYQPVLKLHHQPPAQTVRLTLDNGEIVVPSGFHRFWLAGKGWAMARELKEGDVLRSTEGPVKIVKAKKDAVVPVFNLDVATDHTYFVGRHQYLVRDNTLPPTQVKVFDAPLDENTPNAEPPAIAPKIGS